MDKTRGLKQSIETIRIVDTSDADLLLIRKTKLEDPDDGESE